jgi:hypothetical protein
MDDEEEVVGSFEEEHYEEADVETDAGEEDDAPKKKRGVILQKPRANVYTVMMIVSLVALSVGCLCLYGEMKTYNMDFRARGAR